MKYFTKLTPLRCLYLIIAGIMIGLMVIAVIINSISDTQHLAQATPEHRANEETYVPDGRYKHLSWFIQVSDIHISLFYDLDRGPDLRYFVTNHIMKIIKPEAVVITGDITDAKYRNLQGSTQFEKEWQTYRDILQETGVLNSTVWLDIRGNHDAFDVSEVSSKENMFRRYSNQGKKHSRSYSHKFTDLDGDTISFIIVDACPDPGPKRPFNFFGVLNQSDIKQLEQLKEANSKSNRILWFGHYPTSIVWSPYPGFRQTMSNSVYMNGHLHNFLGYIPTMYALHDEGLLELELADWKDNRMYRIFAVDHGLFSFVDVNYNQWPVILITNPKHGLFSIPQSEPSGRIKHSTHIRVLVFSKFDIASVKIKIDKNELGVVKHVKGPLYVAAWQPNVYLNGVHEIEVFAEDTAGNTHSLSQPFSLDNSKLPFTFVSRFLLKLNHVNLCKVLFFTALFCSVVPLLILRVCNIQVEAQIYGDSCSGHFARCVQTWIRRLYLVANTDRLMLLVVGFNLYIAIGPLFIGELITDHIGVAFVHGLYIRGAFIPGTLTYVYGYFQIITFNIPLTLYLGRVKDVSLIGQKQMETSGSKDISKNTSVLTWAYHHIFFIGLLIFQFYMGTTYYKAYGTMAFLLCPVRTWCIPLAIYMRHIALQEKTHSEQSLY